MSNSAYNSFNSSPRSPLPILTVDRASSPSEHSDGMNSPPSHGRRLRVQELLTESNNAPGLINQLPRSPLLPAPSPSPSEFLTPRYVHNLTIPTAETNQFYHQYGQQLLTPNTTPNSMTPTSPLPPLFVNSPTTSSSTVTSPKNVTDDMTELMPLSLAERRERNKVASAKYRAKKHKQTQEMSTEIQGLNSKISVLMSEKGFLSKQVQELKEENAELKALVDELKSKLVEKKLLKRLSRDGVSLTRKVNSSTVAARHERTKHGFSGHAKGTTTTKTPL